MAISFRQKRCRHLIDEATRILGEYPRASPARQLELNERGRLLLHEASETQLAAFRDGEAWAVEEHDQWLTNAPELLRVLDGKPD